MLFFRVLFIIFLMLSFGYAEQIRFSQSFDTAKTEALKDNKRVMLILSQDGCNMCDYLKYVIFKNTNVIEELHNRFIVVDIDIHKSKVPSGFRALGTPTIYFIDGNGKKIGRPIYGIAKPEIFLETLQNIK